MTIVHLLGRGPASSSQEPPRIEPLTPAWAARIRLPLISRFSTRTLIEHVREFPDMALVTHDGRAYAVAGPWRRRSEIAELIEVSGGKHRVALLHALSTTLADQGYRLIVLDYGPNSVDPGLVRDADLQIVERIIQYERSDTQVVSRPSSLEVRRYTQRDRNDVLKVERESFPWLWWNSSEEWDAYVATPGVDVIVGVQQGQIVGYAGMTAYYRDGHLDRLAVRQSDQGRGFGATLLVGALTRFNQAGVRRVRLTTQEDNLRSQALYEHYGFRRSRWSYAIYGKWLTQPEGSVL